MLSSGDHFETPFVVNKKNGKYRLIDGNHRLVAIERFLKRNKDNKITVGLCWYDNITEEEERKKYTKWNIGSKQSVNDFVNLYYKDIPITKSLRKPMFPVNINAYPNPNGIQFKLLIGSYLKSQEEGGYKGSTMSAVKLIEKACELKKTDLNIIKQFVEEYVEVFGLPDKVNPHYKSACLAATADIWFRNRTGYNPDEMKTRLVKLRMCERVVFWSGMGGSRTNSAQARKDFIHVINGNRKNKLMV